MHIYKHGDHYNPEIEQNKYFSCTCGCCFSMEFSKIKKISYFNVTMGYSAICPECGKIVYLYSDICKKDTEIIVNAIQYEKEIDNAQKTVDAIKDIVLGKDWYITDPVRNFQANEIILDEVKWKIKKLKHRWWHKFIFWKKDW